MSEVNLHERLGSDAAGKLQIFSDLANRNTCHVDRGRWFDFLLAVHREHAPLRPEELETWLLGDGWPDDAAHELTLEYEFARGLLDRSEGDKGRPWQ